MRLPKYRSPTVPGEVLLKDFLEPTGRTQTWLAERMGVPIQAVNAIVNGRRAVTARMAVLLSNVLGTNPEFWLRLQMAVDLWHAQDELQATVVHFGETSSQGSLDR